MRFLIADFSCLWAVDWRPLQSAPPPSPPRGSSASAGRFALFTGWAGAGAARDLCRASIASTAFCSHAINELLLRVRDVDGLGERP
eukprot:4185292-Pyramimonas_sp.AAC.1